MFATIQSRILSYAFVIGKEKRQIYTEL